MPTSTPPLVGLTRYTRWEQVPDGLHTKTQLAEMDPPLKPGADPVAQVLYHGNSYAPLYQLETAVPKRRATPAQRAALDAARALQYLCRRCGGQADEPLGKGRLCGSCRSAVAMWEQHDRAQREARALIADPTAVLLVVDADPGGLPGTQAVAVIQIHDQQILLAADAGVHGTPERAAVIARLDSLLAGRWVVGEPDHMGPVNRSPDCLVYLPHELRPIGPSAEHPWASTCSSTLATVAGIWAAWYAWTDVPAGTIPAVPRDGQPIPWQRSLDVAADGQSMTALLHRIADGTEPVWEKARWLIDGHGAPASV
ncbi:hypothetical protein ACFWV1_26440 [Streptomyces sp. NPDC058700]|uniref:hypothetical protein n=1 Tax=Streptomyces sp. NPDC058700 TaxID=3346607 RepID=UPI00366110B7